MGCGVSKGSIPGFHSTPSVEYAEQRTKTSKALQSAHEHLLKSTEHYAEALLKVGKSLQTLSSTTVIFDNPARYPPPPRPAKKEKKSKQTKEEFHSLPLEEEASKAEDGEQDGEGKPKVGETDAGKEKSGEKGKEVVEEEDNEGEEEKGEALQLIPVPGVGLDARKQLEDIALRMAEIFGQMAEVYKQPVNTAWANKVALSKKAMPPLTLEASMLPDGTLEPIGNSLHKLALWENHLKDEVKAMESVKHELEKSDKALERHTAKASKNPSADLKKLKGAQGKKNSASSHLTTKVQDVLETYKYIEAFKIEVLFPQIARLFPIMSGVWKENQDLFERLLKVSSGMAQLNLVIAEEYEFPELAEETKSDAPVIPGATTRPYHDATKGLDDCLAKWAKSLGELNKSQHLYTTALMTWIRTTMSAPGEFPKLSEEELAQLPKAPAGLATEASFAELAGDWEATLNQLPEPKLKEALESLRHTLQSANALQVTQVQKMKDVEKAKKELVKIEARLEKATKLEEELKKAVEETKDDPERVKEHEARERQLDKTLMEVQVCTTGLGQSQGKFHNERVAYTKLIIEECNTAGSALQAGLPEMFRVCSEYCVASSDAFAELQKKHLPAA